MARALFGDPITAKAVLKGKDLIGDGIVDTMFLNEGELRWFRNVLSQVVPCPPPLDDPCPPPTLHSQSVVGPYYAGEWKA